METIRFTERRRTSKAPLVIVMCFLIFGGAFVAYAIKNEDNPRMLGFSADTVVTETSGLENIEVSAEEKLQQAMNLNYEIKEVSSIDKSVSSIVSDIHLPTVYIDGKEQTEFNTTIQAEYTERFEKLKESLKNAESNYSFNVTYTYCDNIVGTRKVVSMIVNQQVIDIDSNKVTSERVTAYNLDLASKTTLSQADVLVDILGKDAKTLLKDQVKDYVINKGLATSSSYNYEITGLESFYIKEGAFHIVFNSDYDSIVKSGNGVLDFTIEKIEE